LISTRLHNLSDVLPLIAFGLLLGLYLWLTWGFIGIWWGDYGRWLHEVGRFASGEIPYRDFSWPYPPLAIYLFGAFVASFGDDINTIRTLSAAICLGIFAMYLLFIRDLLEKPLVAPVFVVGFLLAVSYSSIESETLAAGMYTPAAPLGALLILAAAYVYLRIYRDPHLVSVIAAGVLPALAIGAKQDYWIPALCLLAFVAFRIRHKRAQAFALAATFFGVLIAGAGFVITQAGLRNFLDGLAGFNIAREQLGRIFPSWERIVCQLILSGVLALLIIVSLRLSDAALNKRLKKVAWLMAGVTLVLLTIYVGASVSAGQADTFGSLALLARRIRLQGAPLLGAPIALVWLVRQRHSIEDGARYHLLFFLLCLAIAARSRRLFEHVEWHNFLFELPALVMAVGLAWPRASLRANRLLLAAIFLTASFSFVDWTLGPALDLPTFGRPTWGKAKPVETIRGRIWLPERDARAFNEITKALDSIDPGRAAPIFSVGYQGGWSYFTGRPNPSPLTQGFFVSNRDPQDVLNGLLSVKPIVIDAVGFHRPGGYPVANVILSQWDLTYQDSYHLRVDDYWYRLLLSHYEKIAEARGRFETWTIYRWRH